jgi:Oxidoreductase family, C-terminal alpha/beta domain/Oxidoreductase family, NAD-binding Rossmann fold
MSRIEPQTSEAAPESAPNLTRRDYLKATAAVGAACLAPTVIPASALGRDGATAPSERIVLGAIGLGSRGEYDLKWMLREKDVQFVAICDARKVRREAIKQIVDTKYGNSDCQMYPEMREFLASRSDIDALLIATGDRWHSLAACMAMRAGKDVYSEKPSSMTVAEGRGVIETARRYGRVYQTGVQRLSEGPFVTAIELARSGQLGQVHTVYAHIAPWDAAQMSHAWLPEEPQPPKEEVDWDAWLGPCPWRPYNSTYIQGAWRGHYDFHTSCIGEWGAHTFAQSQAGINALSTSAVEYHYVKNASGDGMVTKFANGVKMILSRGDKYWHGSCGMRFEGTDGWVACADGYKKPEVSSPGLLECGEKLLADYMDRTQRPMNHVRNFFDCVKSRQTAVASPDVMHHSMSTVHAANICMWLTRDLKFDPMKEEFINDPEANRYLTRAQREPWIF